MKKLVGISSDQKNTKVYLNKQEILCLENPIERIIFLNLISKKAIKNLNLVGVTTCYIDINELKNDSRLYSWNLKYDF